MIFVLPNPAFQLARDANIEHDPAPIGHHINVELFHVPDPSSRAQARDLAYARGSHKVAWPTIVQSRGPSPSVRFGMTRDWAVRVRQKFPPGRLARDKRKKLALPHHHRLRIRRRLRHHFVGLSNAHHFFDRGNALSDASPAIVPQRFHALRNSALL